MFLPGAFQMPMALLPAFPTAVRADILQVWQLSCYAASITAHVARIPDAAQAAGLQASATPWPLLGMLTAAAATAALAGSRGSSSGQHQMPPRLQALLARLARLQGSSSTPASPTAAHAPGTEAAAAPWLLAWALLLGALWYTGLAAVPAVVFVVGSLCYDVLHGAYLAGEVLRRCALTGPACFWPSMLLAMPCPAY